VGGKGRHFRPWIFPSKKREKEKKKPCNNFLKPRHPAWERGRGRKKEDPLPPLSPSAARWKKRKGGRVLHFFTNALIEIVKEEGGKKGRRGVQSPFSPA